MSLKRGPSARSVPFYPCWRGGFPYYSRLQQKVGTLLLTSLLEDPDSPEPSNEPIELTFWSLLVGSFKGQLAVYINRQPTWCISPKRGVGESSGWSVAVPGGLEKRRSRTAAWRGFGGVLLVSLKRIDRIGICAIWRWVKTNGTILG